MDDVLIVGAGPTGMALALALASNGVECRLVDRSPEPATASRALAVHARTLELYAGIGLADAAIGLGVKLETVTPWVDGRRIATVHLGDIGAGLSPFPFVLILPQDVHERLLAHRLSELGIVIERGTTLENLVQDEAGVLASLAMPDGSRQTARFAYVAGCDGARSATRRGVSIGFPGGTYEQIFYVADVEAEGAMADGGLHVVLARATLMAVFPMQGAGRCRLVGIVPEAMTGRSLDASDLNHLVPHGSPIAVRAVHWLSTYHVHHRVADLFASGRVLLLGDAAHLHSPAGGQGMNTGIGDAFNLGWKLAAVLQGRAPPSVLDTYETERRAFAERLVATTDHAFSLAVDPSFLARTVRLHVVPRLLWVAAAFRRLRRFMFRTVSQTAISYRHSALSEGRAGPLHAGERMPWLPLDGTGSNYALLDGRSWHIEVGGPVSAGLAHYAAAHGLRTLDVSSAPAAGRAGIVREAMLLIRPDGHIALAAEGQAPEVLEAYRLHHGLVWTSGTARDPGVGPGNASGAPLASR